MYQFENESMCKYENISLSNGFNKISGIDEAGRGAFAGPLVAACVMLDPDNIPSGIKDSKKLTPKKRKYLFKRICDSALSIGIGCVKPSVIDEVNIYNATKIAMKLAVSNMDITPDFLLIDAVKLYDISINSISMNKGEDKSVSIAAASIIAKVKRDDIMVELSKEYPEYRFDAHKGYGTLLHKNLLIEFGPSKVHRYSYKPVYEVYKLWQSRK